MSDDNKAMAEELIMASWSRPCTKHQQVPCGLCLASLIARALDAQRAAGYAEAIEKCVTHVAEMREAANADDDYTAASCAEAIRVELRALTPTTTEGPK